MSKYVKIGYNIVESWNVEGSGSDSISNPYPSTVNWYSGPDGINIYDQLAADAESTGEDQYGLFAYVNAASYTNYVYHYIEPAGVPDRDETYGYDTPRCRCGSNISFYIGVDKNKNKISAKVKSFMVTQNYHSGFTQPYTYYGSLAGSSRYFPITNPLIDELWDSIGTSYYKRLYDGVSVTHRKTTEGHYTLDEYDASGFHLDTSYTYNILIELDDSTADKLVAAVPEAVIVDIDDIMVIKDAGGPKHIRVPNLYPSYNPDTDWVIDNLSVSPVPTRFDFPELNKSGYPSNWVIANSSIPYCKTFPKLNESSDLDLSYVWVITDDIPYRIDYPSMYESSNIRDEWVISVSVEPKTWIGLTNFTGAQIWSDGINTYYSYNNDQYVLDKDTGTWKTKIWKGLTSFSGQYIWEYDGNVYYSRNSDQYVLDKSTGTWVEKAWEGLTSFVGLYIWFSASGGVFYSNGSKQYLLNKSTGAWSKATWSGVSQPDPYYIWTDGVDTYYTKQSAQYVKDGSLLKWKTKKWYGVSQPLGTYVWTDGFDIYYTYDSVNYVLDKSTSTWIKKTLPGSPSSIFARNVWTDGENLYYSQSSVQYIIRSNPPYRLDFPALKTSRDAKHDWYIDDDVPFQGGFPALYESEAFDIHDKWVATTETEDTGDLIFLKLTIPFTVTVSSGSNAFTLYTPFDNSKINYFNSRNNYGTRDCQLSVKLEYNVPIYQMDFTKSNNLVSDMARNGFSLYPNSVNPTTGRPHYNNTDYSSESHVWSYKNTDLQSPEYNSYYKSYVCIGEFDCKNIQGAASTGSTDFTYGFIFAFHSNVPSDMDKYNSMLEYYGDYIEPFYYTRSTVPYRLDFPSLNTSLPGTDIWVIDGDYPYRIEFPPMHESNGGYTGWIQNTGYEPYRPWPNHKTIFQSVQPIEVPSIDWSKGMQQTFEYFKVNPKTWNDTEQITSIISSNLTKDTDSDMRGHASIEISELLEECYIRTYLKVKQAGFTHRICLGTHLYMMTSDSFNGMRHQYNMTGYTPLVELREKLAAVGYNVTGTTGEVNGKVAPMISDTIVELLRQNTRLKVDDRVQIKKPLLNNFVAGTSDNLLTVVNNLLNATSLQKYEMNVDERGEVFIREAITVYNERHVFEYTDDNSSILMADIDLSVDMSSIPNVLEVIYCGDKNKDIGAIRVVVRNEDPNSIVSTVARGREIWSRYTISNIATPVNTTLTKEVIMAEVEAQAKRLLEAASTIKKTIQYEHGYCDVEVGDTVLFNYKRAGLIGIKAKVVSQTITCKPGCKVSEMAVYTKKLWNRGV